jgi:hypothetical protein
MECAAMALLEYIFVLLNRYFFDIIDGLGRIFGF